MHMVAPRTGAPEVTIAENQTEYKPIVAAVYQNPEAGDAEVLLTRWRFTDVERRLVADGEDFYLAIQTFGQPLQPLAPQIGPDGYIVAEEPV